MTFKDILLNNSGQYIWTLSSLKYQDLSLSILHLRIKDSDEDDRVGL